MPYYTNQMLMGHTQPTYYYPQATSSYNVGAHGMPPTANLSQYVAGSPTTIVDGSRQPIASTGGPHMQSEQKKHATGMMNSPHLRMKPCLMDGSCRDQRKTTECCTWAATQAPAKWLVLLPSKLLLKLMHNV